MERQKKIIPCQQHLSCGYCGYLCREKNFSNHLYRKHNNAPRKVADSEEHAKLLRLQWEEDERKKKEEEQLLAIEKEKLRLLEKKKERERQAEIERQQILQRKEEERRRKEEELKKKKERKRKKAQAALSKGKLADPNAVSHDHDYGVRSTEAQNQGQERTACSANSEGDMMVTPAMLPPSSTNLIHTPPAGQPRSAYEVAGQESSWDSDVSEEQIRKRFHEAKRIEDVSRCSSCFEYDEEGHCFSCTPCQRVWGGKSGLVNYPPSDPGAPDSIQKAKFRDLKKKMLNHLENSARHQTAVKELGGQSRSTEEDEMNYEAGLAVGRTAYGGLKKGGSYSNFETDIAMKSTDLKRLGKNPGNINHSASFAGSLTSSFHDELHEQIKEKLHKPLPGTGEPPPFAIVCDKMTPAGQTLHNVGIISPVDNGKLFATYVQAMPTYDGSGSGSAQEVKDALSNIYPPELLKSRFVGAAVDGAYVNNNFKEHLLDKLEIAEEAEDAYTENWDPAHIIECAGKDSRQQKGKNQTIGVGWIKNVHDTVNSVENKYSFGKGWQDVQDNAKLTSIVPSSTDVNEMPADHVVQEASHMPSEREVQKVKKLSKFSTTRFTTHAATASSAFRNNWGEMYDCMKASDDGKLNLIKNPEFVLGLCGMEDVYEVIGEASRKVQSSRLYPWNVTETLEKCVDDLDKMADCLNSSNPDHLVSENKLKNFRRAAEELSSRGKYQGRELETIEEARPFFEDEITKMRGEVAENISKFTEALKSRMCNASQRSNELAREVFALQRIQNRDTGEIPPELRELTTLQKSAGFISKDIEYPQVEKEYITFVDVVKNEARKPYKHSMDFISKEEKIYSGLFMSAEKTNESRNVVRMLANTSCQTHCEAITEGWGSTIGNTVAKKVNLDHTKLSQEVYVKLNGPAPFEQSNKVIEGALDRHFGSRHRWRFFKTTKNAKGTSKVVERMCSRREGFPLD